MESSTSLTDACLLQLPSYLYPRFDALESGATPNYAEIHAYLADGIALEYVEDYIRHVPPVLPPPRDHGAVRPAIHARVLDNRIPLIPRALIDTAVVAPIVAHDNSTASEEEIAVQENHECVVVRNDSLADPGETLIEWEESHKDEIQSDGHLESEGASVEQLNDCPTEEARAPSPAPLAPTARAQSQKLLEASPEKTKPACRAAPRMVPDFRSLQQRPEPPPNAFLGAPLMSAPSVPAFFVFPPPPPYPSFPVHPAFPPRCPPGLEGFSPQRTFHPQMRPPHYPRPAFGPPPPIASSGPVYSSIHSQQPFSSGPVYTANHPQPAYACPPASVPNTLVFTPHISSTPVSSRPILKSSDSPAAPVSTVPPLEGSRPAPPVVATASVAPTVTTAHSHSPPPPYNGGPRRFSTGHGDVTLSVSECEIFNLLSSVDPNAAHWYMVDAISRAMSARTTDATHSPVATARESDQRSAASRLNPEASEFRSSTLLRPPRGFNGD
ncbi:hypothetical protein O0L34_g3723 [Tuta absoluta]|nr:hypothetical protein O0L34_g3723 [Tuta absoluta]